MEEIKVARPGLPDAGSVISLERGDILKVREADILVVSAFAGDYFKTKSSLIGQLWRSEPSIDVAALERTPAADLRGLGRTWLSEPLPSGAPASRLLCFESPDRGPVSLGPTPITVIADLFRGLNTALMLMIGDEAIEAGTGRSGTVVTPIVASGDQGYPIEDVLPELLDAAIAWIGQGAPIGRLRIIIRDDREDDWKWITARRLFCAFRADYYRRQPPPAITPSHDIFLSYARKDAVEADAIVTDIGSEVPGIRIWRDTSDMEPGENWRARCFGAVDDCRLMLCLLTSNYIGSKACIDEYAAGWCRQDRLGQVYQIPLLLYSCDLPSYLDSRMRYDCAEYDRSKLHLAYAGIRSRLAAT